MNRDIVFSVIIPVFNAESSIEQSIQSILNQDLNMKYEVIIVNDGSTDKTRQILDKFEKEPIVRIIDQKNQGVSAARNTGMKVANGMYFVFADADDLFSTDYLSVFYDFMSSSDMVITGYNIIDKKNNSTQIHVLEDSTIDTEEFLERILSFRDLTSACWNKCFKKEIISKYNILFQEDISIGEDLLFLVEYAVHCDRFQVLHNTTYSYIISANNAMSESKTQKCLNMKWFTEWYSLKKAKSIMQNYSFLPSSLPMKEVRVSNKLLNVIRKYNLNNAILKNELQSAIRSNYFKAIKCEQFSLKQKISITINGLI